MACFTIECLIKVSALVLVVLAICQYRKKQQQKAVEAVEEKPVEEKKEE